MSRAGGFSIMNHIGSLIIVGVTLLVCLFCLILQICKRLTRRREEFPMPVAKKEPQPISQQEPSQSIGWNTSVMDSGDYASDQFAYNKEAMEYHSPYVDSKVGGASQSSGTQREMRIIGREQPGFKDNILYGGPRREVGWTDS